MRRTDRLFQIIQILRSARRPVTGRELADELEISLRTLYRDMAELIAQRVPVQGEAGTGYVLRDGYDMPPLMLTPDELEAAALGAAWVAARCDPALAAAARDLVAKLSEAIPEELRPYILESGARTVSFRPNLTEAFDTPELRLAIRERLRLTFDYSDADNRQSRRTIWPLFIAYLEEVRIVVAWCETRQDFRHFRTDRIAALEVHDTPYPAKRSALIRQWEGMQKASGYRAREIAHRTPSNI